MSKAKALMALAFVGLTATAAHSVPMTYTVTYEDGGANTYELVLIGELLPDNDTIDVFYARETTVNGVTTGAPVLTTYLDARGDTSQSGIVVTLSGAGLNIRVEDGSGNAIYVWDTEALPAFVGLTAPVFTSAALGGIETLDAADYEVDVAFGIPVPGSLPLAVGGIAALGAVRAYKKRA
ncbi:MAG: hypothetical protein AAGF71_13975 [Pseudomonadota bacterium]